MPLIKSAIKKMKQDKKKTARNKLVAGAFKKTMKGYEASVKNKKKVALTAVYSTVDKAVTRKLIHKNKADRLKAKFSKLLKAR